MLALGEVSLRCASLGAGRPGQGATLRFDVRGKARQILPLLS